MKFYGQFDPPVDRFIFERYFPDTNIQGVFVECGAFDGLTECSCKFFEETMGWTGFNLEPVPWLFESILKNRPLSKNLNVGLSNRSGILPFKHAISPLLGKDFGNGSLHHAKTHLESLVQSGCTFQDIEVKITTWRELVDSERLTHVDLFVLDVEGHELSVIEGMNECEVLPDIMCVEFGHIGIDAIRYAMSKLGYIYDITSHGNAYFIKKDVIGLFAFRRNKLSSLPNTSDININDDQQISAIQALKQENIFLRQREQELTSLYEQIISSKGWRIIEFFRSQKSLGINNG